MEVEQGSSFEIKKFNQEHTFIGIPVFLAADLTERSPKGKLPDPAGQYHLSSSSLNESHSFNRSKVDSVVGKINKLGEGVDNFTRSIQNHVKLVRKISETAKGKMRLGAKIFQVGGVKKVFKHLFSAGEEERLLKASQCYLSTTAGPIAGLLFISTDRISFCSDRSIELFSPIGEKLKIRYKVSIPIRKIKRVDEYGNVKKPSRKYIQVVTNDNFEFWFMGFLNHHKAFRCLHQAISYSQ